MIVLAQVMHSCKDPTKATKIGEAKTTSARAVSVPWISSSESTSGGMERPRGHGLTP
jgi:hypothetical protein